MISIPQETLDTLTQFNLTMGASLSTEWADALHSATHYITQMFGAHYLLTTRPPPPLTASREALMKRSRYRGSRKAKRALLRLGMRYVRVDHLQTGEPCRFCGMKTVPPDAGYILCPNEACLRETSGRLRGLCVPADGWSAETADKNTAPVVGVDDGGTSEGQDHG